MSCDQWVPDEQLTVCASSSKTFIPGTSPTIFCTYTWTALRTSMIGEWTVGSNNERWTVKSGTDRGIHYLPHDVAAGVVNSPWPSSSVAFFA